MSNIFIAKIAVQNAIQLNIITTHTKPEDRIITPRVANKREKYKNEGKRLGNQVNECEPKKKPKERSMTTIKNNNLKWHSLNKKLMCNICDCRVRGSVNHYLNFHPDNEVLVSRIAPNVAYFLRNRKDDHQCEIMPVHNRYEYKQYCYFCNKSKSLRKYSWIEHLASHTGCYKYKCSVCSKKYIRTTNRNSKCNIVRVPQPQFDKLKILAYICDLCNYVRFDKTEIEKHLECEHDGDVANRFKRVTFLSFQESEEKLKKSNNKEIAEALRGELIYFTSRVKSKLFPAEYEHLD